MIDVGEPVKLKGTFNKDGVIADPTQPVTFAVRSRSGTITTGTATRLSEGVYEGDFTPSESGTHHYTFFSDDDGIEQGTFTVNAVIAKE